MKGLVLTELGHIKLQDVEKPKITADSDVIIKITLTTICGSDIHLMHGQIPSVPPYVLGHEYVGVVEEVGKSVRNLKPGDRVAGPAAPFCGQCENCRRGNIAQCMNGGIHGSGPSFGNIPGTHAEFTKVPFSDVNMVKIPDSLSDEQVLFVGDILSTGFFAVENGEVHPGDNVVIFGAGPVGLCAVQSAKLFSAAQIILVDFDQFRLDVGQKLGATRVIRPDQEDVMNVIGGLTNGRGVDVAIDAVGLDSTFQQAVRCAGIGGRVSLVGIGGDVNLPLSEVFMKNISIKMGLGYLGHMEALTRLIATGQIDLLPLITHRMKLNQIGEAYKLFENHTENVLKIAISM